MQNNGSAVALVPQRQPASAPTSAASALDGWSDFLTIEENAADDAMPIRSLPDRKGPRVLFSPDLMSREAVDHPAFMSFWVPMALGHFADAALRDAATAEPRFSSDRWKAFRVTCAEAMDMTWTEIVEAAGRIGTDDMADNLAAALYIESGVQAIIAKRGIGTQHLRLV